MTDESYAERHAKLESEEKRVKRLDLRRQRDELERRELLLGRQTLSTSFMNASSLVSPSPQLTASTTLTATTTTTTTPLLPTSTSKDHQRQRKKRTRIDSTSSMSSSSLPNEPIVAKAYEDADLTSIFFSKSSFPSKPNQKQANHLSTMTNE